MEKPNLRKPEVEQKEAEPKAPVVDPVQQEREALKAEREKFQKEREDLSKQLEETQRKLSETAAERATLEAKINQREAEPKGPDPEVASGVREALETAQLDPEKGAEILTKLIDKATTKAQKQAVEQAIDTVGKQAEFQRNFTAHVEKVRKANEDLADFEPDIARLAAEKMQTERMPYDKAIDQAVTEVRKRVEIFKKKIQGDAPAPKGSQGESGGAAIIEKAVVPAPGDTGESAEDYISLRKQKLASH